MEFSPDGKYIAAAQGIDPIMYLWEVQSGREVYSLEGARREVVFSPDGTQMVFSAYQSVGYEQRGGLVIWDMQTRSQRNVLLDYTIDVSDFHPSEPLVLLNTEKGLEILNLETEEVIQVYEAPENDIRLRVRHSGVFSNEGDKILAHDDDHGIRVIDINSQTTLYEITGEAPILNPAKEQFVYWTFMPTGPRAEVVRFVELNTGVETSTPAITPGITTMAFSLDGSLLVTSMRGFGDNSKLEVWDSKGLLLETLAGDGGEINIVAFTPDGKTLISGGYDTLLWGSHSEPVVLAEVIEPTSTAVSLLSPRRNQIVFHTGDFRRGDNYFEVGVINADGTGFSLLTSNPGTGNASPRYSPDGTKIVFDSQRDGNSEIYVMNRDGSGQTRLTFNRDSDYLPAWTTDGTKITFTSDRDGDPKRYIMNLDGTDQVLAPDGIVETGVLSPDNTKLLYQSEWDGQLSNLEILISDADGNNEVQLTSNSFADYAPSWSSDGSEIYFMSDRAGYRQLYMMNADGSSVRNISNTFSDVWEYCLPPDKSYIAFGSDDVIQIVKPDGSGLVNTGVVGVALDCSP